jgi:RNA recognition motif-containing protein
VVEVKLHKKGGYGFVRFEKHESAVRAIVAIHGQEVGGRVCAPSASCITCPCRAVTHISCSWLA